MMKLMIIVLCTIPAALGYSIGPPVSNANLCTAMIPTGHNNGVSNAADQDAPPYTITTSQDMYMAGGSIMVTITGSGSDFKGFFIQARRTDPALGIDMAIGTFSAPPANTQLLMCHMMANSAWGHSSGASQSSVTATWTAPAQDEGPLEFKATIVKGDPDRSYFYLGVRSAQFNFSSDAAPSGAPTMAPSAGPTDGMSTPSSGSFASVSILLAFLSAIFAFLV